METKHKYRSLNFGGPLNSLEKILRTNPGPHVWPCAQTLVSRGSQELHRKSVEFDSKDIAALDHFKAFAAPGLRPNQRELTWHAALCGA
jgi:hypothetical protein